ncbi:aldehyde dehydrogenase family 7 member B4-like [Papaver somniferum]|uniref:aldehyde dehydrogenase family 7 member B4-like n=1 Tax=Papaver somniferum TaxID=3469 RepID=UPI000E6FA53E|nr:aldehyde dehydrogenase family 7 member B4-like [Papaver somniferum]
MIFIWRQQLNGLVVPSDRSSHVIAEMWNYLSIMGAVTVFHFPCFVLGWNTSIAFICGNFVVWKGASTTPLITIAITEILSRVLKKNNLPGVIFIILHGGAEIGEAIAHGTNIFLVSFHGTTKFIHGRWSIDFINATFFEPPGSC